MPADLSKLDLHALAWNVRRNLPAFDTTWAACDQPACTNGENGTRGVGRGGGPCLGCLTAEIARRFGKDAADAAVAEAVASRGRLRGEYPAGEAAEKAGGVV